MTFRLMPHSRVAPFVGAGGSYNLSLRQTDTDEPGGLESRGNTYWGGHVEAGIRVWLRSPWRLLEIMGRYTWSSLDGDRDYWLVGISTGPAPGPSDDW
jgi:hypothetical protein